MNSTPSTPQPAAGPEPGRDVAGVYVACGVIRTSMPSAREGNAIAPQYAEQARLHHERAVASLDEIEAPRPVPLSRAQRQELLTRALEDVIFACRLLLRAQQELRGAPGTALEPRRARMRALVETLEQQLYRLVR